MERIVLAYSGGLDTLIAIPWLLENYDAEVVTLTLDLGQGRDLADIRERALALGVVRAHVIDVREELVRDYILPALKAGAFHDGHPIATALGRLVIAKRLVEIARMEGANAIAHGSTGTANGHMPLDASVRALGPSLRVIAPARLWAMTRADEIEYARAHNITVSETLENRQRTDANVWGRSLSFGALEETCRESAEDVYTLTRSPEECPDEPACIDIEFDGGIPVRANGVEMPVLELIESLETIAGAHGVGRMGVAEDRLAGVTTRQVHEAPAGFLLHTAHDELEKLVMTSNFRRLKRLLTRAYVDLIESSFWFSPMREAIDAFVGAVQPRVTGAVRLELFKGDCRVVERRSPFALPDHALTVADTARTPSHKSSCANA
jgi:argininosuccinate synthase